MNILKELGRNSQMRSYIPRNPLFRVMSTSPSLGHPLHFSKSTEMRKLSNGNDGTTHHARTEAANVCATSGRELKNAIKSGCNRLHGSREMPIMPRQLDTESKLYRDNVYQRQISWRNFESNGFYNMMKGSGTHTNYVVPSNPTRKSMLSLEKVMEFLEGTWWNAELVQITETLNYLCQFPPKYYIGPDHLLQGICSILESAPDDKSRSIPFLCALTYFDCIISTNYKLYHRFSRALNTYCLALLPRLLTDEILQVFHCYRLIGNPTIQWQGSFPQCAMMALERQMHTFKTSQLVQLCYFISICRKQITDMNQLQQSIEKHIGNMRVGEMALVISAFFKTNVPIVDNQILYTIVYKAKQGRKNMDPLYFTTILKSLRFHEGSLKEPSILMLFLEYIHLDKIAMEEFSHFVHYTTVYLIYREELMEEIRNRLECNIKLARLKDVVKLLMYVSRVGYSSKHADAICNIVMDHLKSTCYTSRAVEIKHFSFTFVNCLTHLSSMNKYDPELLDLVLNEKVLSRLHLEDRVWMEIWFLDRNILIDFPEYAHNRLSQEYHKLLAKIAMGDRIAAPQHHQVYHFEQIISSVVFTFKNMFNCTSCVIVGRVLPQYAQQNIIICLDKATGRGIPIRSDFLPKTLIQPRFVSDTDDVKWLAIEIIPETRAIFGSSKPYGLNQTKLRHLRSLGYIPYIINESDWFRHVTEAERFSYLGKLISNNRNDRTIKASAV